MESIQRNCGESIRASDWYFEDEISNGAPTVIQALREIFSGAINSPQHAWQYGYALEYICKHIGKHLQGLSIRITEGAIQLYSSDPNVAYLLEMISKPSTLPIPIPIPDDFPYIKFLNYEECIVRLDRISRVGWESEDIASMTHALRDYKSWLQIVVDEHLSLITFCY